MIRDFVLPAALLSLAQLTFCHVQRAPEVTGTDIPAEMRGRWGLTRTDCDVTRPDAKGAMLVSSEMLGFYESHARLDEVHEVSPRRITASYGFTGEGMSWGRDVTLALSPDGATLIRTQSSPDSGPVTLGYDRCG